jgi:hypothetical protein
MTTITQPTAATATTTPAVPGRRLSVAPMMDWK